MRSPFRRRREPQLCVVYGNCQAEPLRALLDESPEFSSRIRTEAIPAIPRLRTDLLAGENGSLEQLRDAVSRASLVITQRIRDDYHGLPLGTDQVLAFAPVRSRTITFPAPYHDGTYPHYVYVPMPGDAPPARPPLIEYQDLRLMACASRGIGAEEASRWLSSYEPPPDALRRIEAQADASLAGSPSRISTFGSPIAFAHRSSAGARSTPSTIRPCG